MRILTVNSSGRRSGGHTEEFLAALARGARSAGAEVQALELRGLELRPCTGCLTCWFRTPGLCAVQDDLPQVREAFLAADVVVLGTPMYLYALNGRMKTMMERLLFSFTRPEPILIDGRLGHYGFHTGRTFRLILLCTGSFDDPDMFQPTLDTFAHMCRQTVDEATGRPVFDHLGNIVLGFSELLLDKRIRERSQGLFRDLEGIGARLPSGEPLAGPSKEILRGSVGGYAGLDRAASIAKYSEIIEMVKMIYA